MMSDRGTPAIIRTVPASLAGLLAALMLLTGIVLADPADTDDDKSEKVKAAYLYNFAKFIKWPEEKFGAESDPIVMAVLNDDSFKTILQQTVRDKKVGQRDIEVRRLQYASPPAEGEPESERRGVFISELRACHMLYLSSDDEKRVADILALVKDHDVVTSGDLKEFAARGGMIGFVLAERKIVFEINITVVEDSRIKLSSKLLKLAKVIRSPNRTASGPGRGGSP